MSDLLFNAAQTGNIKKLAQLLNAGADPNAKNNDGVTVLRFAAANGHAECVKALLAVKADAEVRANDGRTALMRAAAIGHVACVKALLEGKADPSAKDNNEATALMMAASNCHASCVKTLITGGMFSDANKAALPHKVQDYDKAFIVSHDTIRSWSGGEVKNSETVHPRTFKPEQGGLFCQRIFGPVRDYECACGKYKSIEFKGVTCDRCGVDVTVALTRVDSMGHIELTVPVTHIWFLKNAPSRLGLLLNMTTRHLESVIYYEKYLVVDPGRTPLEIKQTLSEQEYTQAVTDYGEDAFVAKMGAEALRDCLAKIDMSQTVTKLKEQVHFARSDQLKEKLNHRLQAIQEFITSGNKPECMVMETLPVISPELRPIFPLGEGRFATSDLNDLYRRVINRNNRLRSLLQLKTPDVIINNEKRMLQEAVDALFDNGRHGRPVTGAGNRPLKSLSDKLKGKQGFNDCTAVLLALGFNPKAKDCNSEDTDSPPVPNFISFREDDRMESPIRLSLVGREIGVTEGLLKEILRENRCIPDNSGITSIGRATAQAWKEIHYFTEIEMRGGDEKSILAESFRRLSTLS